MNPRRRLLSGSLACLSAAAMLAGCEDSSPTFARIEQTTETIASFQRFQIQGQERLEYRATAPSGVLHAEFLLNWTNLTRDIEVDVYVVRNEDYNAAVPPAALAKVFWTSVPPEGPQFGDRRPTQIHLHPAPGEYVVVFYNPNDRNPSTRATLSASIELSYFK